VAINYYGIVLKHWPKVKKYPCTLLISCHILTLEREGAIVNYICIFITYTLDVNAKPSTTNIDVIGS